MSFTSPQFGIRALAKTLLTYQATHKLDTVAKIIGRWAPPNENDTGAYVSAVAKGVGVPPNSTIVVDSVRVMLPLVKAIIQHENGSQPYSDIVLMAGLRLAGIFDAAPKPLVMSNRFMGAAGGTVASSAVAVIAAAGALQPTLSQVHDTLAPYAGMSPYVGKAVAALAFAAAVLSGLSAFSHALARRNEGA